MKKWIFASLAVALALSLVLAACRPGKPALGTEGDPIVVAFTPFAEDFTKLLSEKTDYAFEVEEFGSYSEAVEAMCGGKVQMATLDAFAYVLAHEQCGVDVALIGVRDGSPFHRGQIIAEEIPNDGVQFTKNFPDDMREKIVDTIRRLTKLDEGREAMEKAFGWEAVVEADDSFYDDLRATLDASGVDVEELVR